MQQLRYRSLDDFFQLFIDVRPVGICVHFICNRIAFNFHVGSAQVNDLFVERYLFLQSPIMRPRLLVLQFEKFTDDFGVVFFLFCQFSAALTFLKDFINKEQVDDHIDHKKSHYADHGSTRFQR